MAIQVNGTTVIDNSRALTNIASVDANTVAALGNAGVGGGSWTTLGTYTTSYYSCTNTQDTGWINMSSILSGLSSTYKLLYIQAVPRPTLYNGSDAGNNWLQFYEGDAFRLGSSSSNYDTYWPSDMNSSYGGTATFGVDYGFTGKTSTGALMYGSPNYDTYVSSMMIGVPSPNPDILPDISAGMVMGNQVSAQYGHIYNEGSLNQSATTNANLGTNYGTNIGYFAWRKYNFSGQNTIANNQQSNFQVGWVFKAAYFE